MRNRYPEFKWFTGVVEDRADPLFLNRVKVRVFGYYTDKKDELDTKDLPWATVLLPTTTSGMSSVGEAVHGLVEGSWVMGFFKDGDAAQDPVVMGTICGNNERAASSDKGFNDPLGIFPRHDGKDTDDRAIGIETSKKIPVGIHEPEDPYGAEYPYNKVRVTESGHIVEFDDTPGSERINIQHRSGAFIELHPDNRMRTRASDKHDAMSGSWIVSVGGDATINVGGDSDISIQGDSTISVGGDARVDVKGDTIGRFYGTSTSYHTSETFINSISNTFVKGANLDIRMQGNIDIMAYGDMNFKANNITMSSSTRKGDGSGGNFTTISKNSYINASTAITAIGPDKIDLNPEGTSPILQGDIKYTDMYTGEEITYDIDNVKYSEDEFKRFKVELEEIDSDISFPTPKHSVVTPDGKTSYSKQTMAYATDGYSLDSKGEPFSKFVGENWKRDEKLPPPTLDILDPMSGNLDIDSIPVNSDTPNVIYVNHFSTRNQVIDEELVGILKSAADATKLLVHIFSGGSDPDNPVKCGSDRHKDGMGADVWLYLIEEGRGYAESIRLSHEDSEFEEFAKACKDSGATGIGAGPGYMSGYGIHVDIAAGKFDTVLETDSKFWGSGGKPRNAPTWLKDIMED